MSNSNSSNPLDDVLDSRGLSIFMLILTLAILGFLIANVVYFRRIANDPSTSASNAKAAKNLGWINIVLAVALGIVVIYYLFKSFTNKQTRDVLYKSAGDQIVTVQNAIPNVGSGPIIAVVPYGGKNITVYPGPDGYYTSKEYPSVKFTCNFTNCSTAQTYTAISTNPTTGVETYGAGQNVLPPLQQGVYFQPVNAIPNVVNNTSPKFALPVQPYTGPNIQVVK